MAMLRSPLIHIEGSLGELGGKEKRPPAIASGAPKSRSVRAVGAILARLPARLRRAILREFALTLVGDYATIQALGRCAAISDISIVGDLGIIQGSLDDSSVLATYCRTKTWRPAFAQFFTEFFAGQERGVFLDIGANIGLTTIPVARESAISCFCFEPDPVNFRHLRNNVQVNCPHQNVHLFNLALFDSAGSLDFQLSSSNKGDHRLCRAPVDGVLGERQWPVIRVPTARLDDVVAPYLGDDVGPIAAKLVVQGAEGHIVAGGRAVLSRAGALVVEVYPYGIERLQGDLGELLRFSAAHFSLAALNAGEQDDVLTWKPVAEIAQQLCNRYRKAAENASDYFHLFLKR